VDVVAEKDRLPGTLEITGVVDDGRLVARRGSGLSLLAMRGRRAESEEQRYYDRS
jgi:hypothetical protein